MKANRAKDATEASIAAIVLWTICKAIKKNCNFLALRIFFFFHK